MPQAVTIACAILTLAMPVDQSAVAAERPIKIVALGDSLTAGFNLPESAAFPARLEKALRAKGLAVDIVNAGVSGDTASGGLSRVAWSVSDGTKGVILELGANDMLRGVDPTVTRKALEEIIVALKARKIEVLLCGMRAAPNLGADYVAAFDSIFPDLARKHGLIFYPFFLDGVATRAGMTLPDGLHPSAAGVDAIVSGILPKVEEFIERIRVAGAS